MAIYNPPPLGASVSGGLYMLGEMSQVLRTHAKKNIVKSINMQDKKLESFDTTRTEEAKAEVVKKCAKITLKCLRVCRRKKRPKKDSQSISKESKI